MPNELPAPVARAGATRARDLDVRPLVAAGRDPFAAIMSAVGALAPDEALHLVAGFEPVPLYGVLRAAGRLAHTERRDGAFHVWFFVEPGALAQATSALPGTAPLAVVDLDVRDLEPPEPMSAILAKLAELGPAAQLRVRLRREPLPLYPRLRERGFEARAVRVCDGDYVVHVAPLGTFLPR